MPRQNIGGRDVASNSSNRTKTVVSLRSEQEANSISRVKELPSRQRTTADAAPIMPRQNSRLANDRVQTETHRDAIASESTQNTVEIQAVKRPPPIESALSEIGLSQDLVIRGREEPAESNRPINSDRQQFTAENTKHAPDRPLGRTAERVAFESESVPSTNIRVTIGRVEIRAVQQQERQAARPTSVPRKPAVSLDAYLKRRDEERR